MATATEIVKQAYAAFGRADIPGLTKLVADEVDWELIGPASLGYAGRRRTRGEVAAFFAQVAQADQVHVFEPHEFIEAGEHVTVLGWERCTALDTGCEFSTEWIHVFTVRNELIVRWRGAIDTAARYGK